MAETWLQHQEEAIELFRNKGQGSEAVRLLETSPTNRTIDSSSQAILAIAARMLSRIMRSKYPLDKTNKWLWPDLLADMVEDYQQTMAGETNSRIQFSRVAVAQFQGILNKAKTGIEGILKE